MQQGLKQIDPNGAGLYIAVFRCTLPRIDGKVRSLYEDTWAMSFPNEKSEEMQQSEEELLRDQAM